MQNDCAQWLRIKLLCSAATVALVGTTLSTPANATINPDTTTPTAIIDTSNTQPYFVGLGIRNEAGNSGGSCSGMLINPRTVIFAAHCVDGLAPGSYDAPTAPGNRAAVGYTMDPTFGTANLRNWLFSLDFGPQPGADGRTMNDSVMVWYDPRSRFGPARPLGDATFLPADIAIAGFALATEALGRDAINGSMLLFSPVTTQPNVIQGGYGQSGTEPGTVRTSDFQRRLGTNNLGFLGNQRDINLAFYGAPIANILSPGTSTYQDMYWTDFDDPQRATRPFFNGPGTTALNASTLDADVFPGNATTNEVNTAPGDSGSPLLTTAFGRQASLGVLSQGSRFFFESLGNPNDNFVRTCQNTTAGTNFSCLGTTSGYNPLFLFWDQIVVNNPYKYVQTTAGDGEWTDGTRWIQELDPLYAVLSGTTLVNGLPVTPALGVSSAAANVGTVRANPSPPAVCAFTGTCPPTGGTSDPLESDLTGSGSAPDSMALPDQVTLTEDTPIVDPSPHTAHAGEEGLIGPSDQALTTALWTSGTLIPVSTGTLTGPGTTNFVPDNTNGTPGLQNSTRFFEVNLRNAGTTFLTGTTITIDRLSVRGATSGLNIRSGATLNTTISSYVDNGNLTVNGTFNPTNLFIFGGTVQGTGTIDALTLNVSGRVAPGNSIGTLNIVGNYAQSPAGLLEIEMDNLTGDVLAVTGSASLSGAVSFQPFGPSPTLGQTHVFLTTGGTRTGTFSSIVDLIPGPLFPIVDYGSNFARVTIGDLCTFSDNSVNTPVCGALGNATALAAMPGAIGQIQQIPSFGGDLAAALEALNPTRAHAQGVVGLQSGDLLRNQFGRRSHDLLGGSGDAAASAQLDMARSQLASTAPTADMLAYAAANALETVDGTGGGGGTIALPNGYAMFFAADVGIAKTDQPAAIGSDDTDVTALTAGIDSYDGKGSAFGVALSYLQSNVSQDYGFGGNTSSDGIAVSGYGSLRSGRLYADGYLSYGWQSFDTERNVPTGPFTIAIANGSTDASQFLAGATLGYHLCRDDLLTLGAVGGLYYTGLDVDGYTETGAGALSAVLPDRTIDSLRSQVGGEAALHLSRTLVPLLRVVWNHEFMDDAFTTQAAFAGAPTVTFTSPGPDLGTDWVTVGAGVSGKLTESTSFVFRYQHDFGRDGQDNQQVSAAARMAF
jgi:outer membrane autotransporter protein